MKTNPSLEVSNGSEDTGLGIEGVDASEVRDGVAIVHQPTGLEKDTRVTSTK